MRDYLVCVMRHLQNITNVAFCVHKDKMSFLKKTLNRSGLNIRGK